MDYRAKISLVGDAMTGKTSLILRYIKNSFTSEYITTLGADFIDKTYTNVELPELPLGDDFTLTIWDMAGQGVFKEISQIYCDGSAGIIIVFDVSNRETFENLPEWTKFAKGVSNNVVITIVGNKNDLPRQITDDDIKNMEENLGLKIQFSSAKAGLDEEISNVSNIFQDMAKKIFHNHNLVG